MSEKAEKRTAYPLKLIVDRQMGHPMTTNKPLFNTWLTESLQQHLFARSAEEAKKEYKEIRKEVRGLSAEVTKLIEKGDDSGKGVIAKQKDQKPEVSGEALKEFFDALAKAMKENPSGKESESRSEPAAVFDPHAVSPEPDDSPSASMAAAGSASQPSLLPSIPLSSDLVTSAIAEVIDLKDLVSGLVEAAKMVVDSIPLLGTIVAAVKLTVKGVSLLLLAKEAYDVCMAKKSSFSLLEKNVNGAITSYQKEQAIQIGKDMANITATGVSAAFGGGSVVSIATKLVDLVAKVAAAIYRAYQIWKINAKIRNRTPLTLQDLRDAPILGLHLPYLNGVDALALLGVAPVGWKTSTYKVGILGALNAAVTQGVLRDTDKGWLTSPLQWNDLQTRYRSSLIGFTQVGQAVRLGGAATAAAAAPTAEKDPWTIEFERVIKMLKVSDKYIYAQKWRLYKDEGTTIVHEPAPVELIDRAQATVKQKVQDLTSTVGPLPGLPKGRGSAVGQGAA